jgi:hypothetical protein
MQAIFMARGPSFNENVQIDSLNNVDIYHIACRILELQPNPYATAGSLVNLTRIFRNTETVSTTTTRPPNHGVCLCFTSPFSIFLMIFLLSFNFEMKF